MWVKSIKFICCCKEEWRSSHSFFKTLTPDFFSLIYWLLKLDYEDYLVQFELFFRDIRNLEILSNEDLDFVTAKTKEAGLSSYRSYNNNVPQNLSKEEFTALQNLSKNKDLYSGLEVP